jgi:hypothetical protein
MKHGKLISAMMLLVALAIAFSGGWPNLDL